MKCYKLTVMYWALLCAGNKSEERQHCAHDKPADKAARTHRMGLCRYQLTSLHAHDVVFSKSEEGLRRALYVELCAKSPQDIRNPIEIMRKSAKVAENMILSC